MTFQVRITTTGLPAAIAKLRKLRSSLGKTERGLFRATNKLAQLWGQNYESEGSLVGGWADLTQTTQEHRRRLNISPDHPILYRYGSLRGIVIDMFATADSNVSQVNMYNPEPNATVGGSLLVSGNVARLTAVGWPVINQWGDDARHLPARPYWFVDQRAVAAAKVGVEDWLSEVIRDLGTGATP